MSHEYFQRTFVVNLPERADRRAEIAAELERADMALCPGAVEIFPAIRPPSAGDFESVGARGCFLSHLQAWRSARDLDVEHLLMIEDDLELAPQLAGGLDAVVEVLAEVDWDLAYLGHPVPVDGAAGGDGIGFRQWEGPVLTTHFYAVRRGLLERLIEAMAAMLERPRGHPDGGPMHLDGALSTFRARNPDVRTVIATPSLGGQRSSHSDITPQWIDRTPGVRHLARTARRLLRARRAGPPPLPRG